MQAKSLIELINNRETLNAKSIEELRELTEEFPFFQAAHLLYTIKLKQERDSRYFSQLRRTACCVIDRKQLFFQVEEDFFPLLEKIKTSDTPKVSNSSFDLIDFFLNKNESSNKKEEKPINTSKGLINTDYLSFSLQEEKGEREVIEESKTQLKHQDAIDKFLEQDELSPIKLNLDNNTEENNNSFSDLDTVEESSFFSETLAKIYIKQKKYDKALEIINKLNLLYPEKNRYFADQIRFLEKLIINSINKV
ncbi:tetratricopeptide (TPR) repeat protein [Dysgonomonadaceae bacterium PH5-43]|nr:tetratricopeptide (TPR) repeat protein [Dysgonomonadaceae bacterium PH5-43]